MDNKSFNYIEYKNKLSEHELKHAPKELFYEGNTDLLLKGKRVSLVGSRNPSEKGIRKAKIFTQELVKRDIIVICSLASGIDTVVHQTAISNCGKTIAVLGTPLNIAYPAKNKFLLEYIKKEQLVISQFAEGYPVQKKNFPMRNRTMALISDATVIIEASENSGIKHQGWEALRLGRLVYIMQNIAENKSLTWPKEMIDYGAQVLTRDNMSDILDDMPSFTSSVNVEFCF